MAQGALQMSLANLVDYLTQEEEDRVVPLSALADAVHGGIQAPFRGIADLADQALGQENPFLRKTITKTGQMTADTPGGVAKIVTEDIPAYAELGTTLGGKFLRGMAQPSTQRILQARRAGARLNQSLDQRVSTLADLIAKEGAMGVTRRGLEAMGEGIGQAIDERGFAAFVGPEDAIPGGGKLLAALGMAAPVARMGKAARAAKKPRVEIGATDVHDEAGGEMYASKILSVDGVPKAGADLSIYGDKVYIQHVQTVPDAQRQGYAKQLIDNLIEEHPDKKIALTLMTDEGQQFFSNTYDIADDMTIAPKPKAAPKAQTLEERAAAVGYTRPAYHGSTHDIREFDLNRANVENYLGQAHYFTTSPKDASANYGGMGPDLKARVEREVEQMVDATIDELADMVDDTVRRQYERKIDFVESRVGQIHDEDLKLRQRTINEQGVDNYEVWPQPVKDRLSDLQAEVQNLKFEKDQIDSQLLLEAAKANLKGPSEGMVYDVQLRLDNPLYIDGSKKEPVFEIETVYDDAGDFVEERGNGLDLVQAIHDAAAKFDDGYAEDVVREFMEKGGDQMLDGMRASEVNSALRGLDSVYDLYDETGDSASTEFIRQVYENLGYDSVIMDPAKEFPHMDNVPTGTRHYIVFDKYANKIRSKRAAFDPKKIGSRDILATVTPIAAPGLAAGYLATREQE